MKEAPLLLLKYQHTRPYSSEAAGEEVLSDGCLFFFPLLLPLFTFSI